MEGDILYWLLSIAVFVAICCIIVVLLTIGNIVDDYRKNNGN